MKIEIGSMVTITALEYAEKMRGIVGMVVSSREPAGDGSTGSETLHRVEFLGFMNKLPPKLPMWWPESDLKIEI
jgi:hypothetical protein